jgi:hypothetical protein
MANTGDLKAKTASLKASRNGSGECLLGEHLDMLQSFVRYR